MVKSLETDSELQSAASNIWLVVIPAEVAADAESSLTECALNVAVSIPADCNVDKIHLAMKDEVTGLCGRTLDKKSFVFLSLAVRLKDSILVMQAIRVSFRHNLLSAGRDGKTNGVTLLIGMA